jgi:CRISPR-associated helicase Cas3
VAGELTVKVLGYAVPQVNYPGVDGLFLYPHQAVMIDEWNKHEAFLLVTKTGSGKTAACALPIALSLHRREDNSAVFVYPTKELIRDQERSIRELLENRMSIRCFSWGPHNADQPVGDEEIVIVRVDADILDQFKEKWGMRRKADVLERLLQADKPKIILINPDILYLLYSLRYGQRAANVLGMLQAYETIVFDEFHLYGGVELAHVLFLIHAAREWGAFRRVVLLSATPDPGVRRWIDRLLDDPCEVTMDAAVSHPLTGKARTMAHDVELVPIQTSRGKEVQTAKKKILELLDEIRQLRSKHSGDNGYVPAVVILNSVVKAIDLEDELVAAGFNRDDIVPIRGLAAREVRRLKPNQLLVIGTSAIEVGIDFQCDYLIFEAGDAASFLQRFGRLGRHQPGTAFLLGDQRECAVMATLPSPLDRKDLEAGIQKYYPTANARAWFVDTEMGAFAAAAQAYSIRRRIEEDRTSDFATKAAVKQRTDEIVEDYMSKLGLTRAWKLANRIYRNFERGVGAKWVGDYLHIDTFRTSRPSLPVNDLEEKARRGSGAGLYEVDVKSLLSRATNPKSLERRVQIEGYHDNHRVTVNMGFQAEAESAGTIKTTADYPNLMLARSGKLDAGSHIMSRTRDHHIFVFVPADRVEDQLDWRIASFPCGGHPAKFVLAFDGDALLLREIWCQCR